MVELDIATFTVKVIPRHSPGCKYKNQLDPKKNCKCRKSLYIYDRGHVTYKSARTRSWEQAERLAQQLRDTRDPIKQLQAEREAKRAAKAFRLDDALDQWIKGQKGIGLATAKSYQTVKRSMLAWAGSKGIELIGDVTPDRLDAWVASWSDSLNTQGFRLSRIRSFFRWATRLHKVDEDPTLGLRSIKRESEEETMPLTPSQFDELIAATYKYDAERRSDRDRFGADLRAVFLIQRWTGLRLVDALMLRRSSVSGNRIITKTKKTGAQIDRVVPDAVIEALNAVPPRKTVHDDQFFWSQKCNHRVLAGMWTPRIRLLNRYLAFKHPQTSETMSFRSHMLRDTFSVQLLLSGMSLDEVSHLLTHESVTVTQKHYAPWLPDRQKQLESKVIAAMRKQGASFGGDSN